MRAHISDKWISWCDKIENEGHITKNLSGTWYCYHSSLVNTDVRDGIISFNGLFWESQNKKIISYPHAIMDDFGMLVPVKR